MPVKPFGIVNRHETANGSVQRDRVSPLMQKNREKALRVELHMHVHTYVYTFEVVEIYGFKHLLLKKCQRCTSVAPEGLLFRLTDPPVTRPRLCTAQTDFSH